MFGLKFPHFHVPFSLINEQLFTNPSWITQSAGQHCHIVSTFLQENSPI